jgi:hypothetical protein
MFIFTITSCVMIIARRKQEERNGKAAAVEQNDWCSSLTF